MRGLFHWLPKIRRLSLIVATVGSTSFAASISEQPATEIRAVMDAQEKAWNRCDIQGFMNGYARSNETVFVSGDSVTRGWQTVLDRDKKKYTNANAMGQLRFSDVHVTALGEDAAVVLGKWTLALPGNEHPHGRFTLIFRHLNDGWRIVHDHTSAAQPNK